MTANKERVEKALERVEKKYQKTLFQVRLKWLQSVYREALEGGYQFKSLGDLVSFIVDHTKEIKEIERERRT